MAAVLRHLQDVGAAQSTPFARRVGWGAGSGDSSGVDFKRHMSNMDKECSAKPLKYGVGVGILEKTDIQHVPLAGMAMLEAMGLPPMDGEAA